MDRKNIKAFGLSPVAAWDSNYWLSHMNMNLLATWQPCLPSKDKANAAFPGNTTPFPADGFLHFQFILPYLFLH